MDRPHPRAGSPGVVQRPRFGFRPWLAFLVLARLRALWVRLDIGAAAYQPTRHRSGAGRAGDSLRPMPWLTRDDQVLAAAEVRRRPGRVQDGAVVLRHPLLITRGPEGALDVAWCRRAGREEDEVEEGEAVEVRHAVTLGPILPAVSGVWAPVVIVARAGCFDRWGVKVGDKLVIAGA